MCWYWATATSSGREVRVPYQPEVDGLRAVAIVAVVLYHLGIPGLAGGFVGVDCFFVISGYLIFSLLYREQQATGTIGWVAFYARRATRLLPEAYALIVAVMVAGYFILPSMAQDVGAVHVLSHHELVKSGVAATFWVANLYFSAVGVSYFEAGVDRQPLVHLWSLGVEEQFYLVVPLMFWLTRSLARTGGLDWGRWAALLLVAAFASSLVLAVWWTSTHAWSAYYALPTRAYEFALGAGAALWTFQRGAALLPVRFSTALAVSGITTLVACCAAFRWDIPFPSAWALVPALATVALILGCGPGAANPVRDVLAFPAVTYLGTISYGWYLWHWPMLVFWREYWLYDVTIWSEAAVAALALVPAALGYHAVARLRQRSHAVRRPGRALALGVAGLGVTLVACGVLLLAADVKAMTPGAQLLSARLKDRWAVTPQCPKPGPGAPDSWPDCVFGDVSGTVTVVLWGDSHAVHWLPALDPLLKDLRARGLLRAHASCPPGLARVDDLPERFNACVRFGSKVLAEVTDLARRESVVVLLFARWALYLNVQPYSVVDRKRVLPGRALGRQPVEVGLRDIATRLRAAGIPVGIAQPVPEHRHEVPNCLHELPAERCAVSWESQRTYMDPAREMVSGIAARSGALVLDPKPLLCPDEVCPAELDGHALYLDDDHLSGDGAKHLREPLRELLIKLATVTPAPPRSP
jgi:peptidoglycan/LPS O-acetylase OafA/YrhL